LDRQKNFPVFVAVVDDELDLAYLFRDALNQIPGVAAFAFSDPLLAFAHFSANRERYGCIISDYRMPSMVGTELLSKVKEINPKITRILISAFEFEDEVFKNIDCVDMFLQKPIMIKDLVEQVQNLVIKSSPKTRETNTKVEMQV
jgi:response regulator RpfG family c-di-GMP phosphodiesterase